MRMMAFVAPVSGELGARKLLLVSLLAVSAPGIALAQEGEQEEPKPPEVKVEPTYPKLEAIAGADFEFEVELSYFRGEEPRDFDLKATAPPGWEVYLTPKYEKQTKVSAIRMEPTLTCPLSRSEM